LPKKRYANPNQLEPYVNYKKRCDSIYLLLLDCGQLRYRISDHTTFRFCQAEIEQIRQFLLSLLQDMNHCFTNDQMQVQENDDAHLTNLEGIYEMVLQVVMEEPLNFLLFIDDIRQLSKLCLIKDG